MAIMDLFFPPKPVTRPTADKIVKPAAKPVAGPHQQPRVR